MMDSVDATTILTITEKGIAHAFYVVSDFAIVIVLPSNFCVLREKNYALCK